MGLGGAFAALADDATAAFANPAGLVQLLRAEASLEGRLRLDLRDDDPEDDATEAEGLGFASLVYPVRRVSFALFTHRVAEVRITPGEGAGPGEADTETTAVTYSLAAGWRLVGSLSLGFGVAFLDAGSGPAGAAGPPAGAVAEGDNEAWALTGGLLWRPGRWRLGLFARQGADLVLEGSRRPLTLPDVHGAGVAVRVLDGRLTLASEWDRVRFGGGGDGSGLAGIQRDSDQLRLGAELALYRSSPVIAYRAGVWSESHDPVDGRRTTHGAVGFGLAWSHVQLDLGQIGRASCRERVYCEV